MFRRPDRPPQVPAPPWGGLTRPPPPTPFPEGKCPLSSWTLFPQASAQTVPTKTQSQLLATLSPSKAALAVLGPTPRGLPPRLPRPPRGPGDLSCPLSLPPCGPTTQASVSLPEAQMLPRQGPNTPKMPLGSCTVPGAAPARPAPWVGALGGRGGASEPVLSLTHTHTHTHHTHTHTHPGPQSLCSLTHTNTHTPHTHTHASWASEPVRAHTCILGLNA